ncbi:valine--tRNA ligase [Miniphocaeibacter massiliensis]|uniref:valine--tRNA ligase n=1 Tax=Miniphocaeibacter massiliensis TaxID=2041841 RepID=UPI000C081E83|nr:valine--tRNA ligase [Miniphocaeibacter massiliensis]
MKNLEKNYDPKSFENRIYKTWKDNGYFVAKIDENKKPFTIVMPPPNVTGNLHLGHALNNTLQDILIRRKRMQGYSALWVPGTDHASISTEMKVVEKITKDGKTKAELGREGFLKEAWAWTEEYGGNIKNQLEKLGVSCDWSRDAFTLDENLSKAVQEVFIKMYNDGLIYRGDRIVNWCVSCGTAVSDAEVVHKDEKGHLWHIRYPFKNKEGYIVIATTRPETMLGDLAVAVNPEDERYKSIVGELLTLPLVEREIPVIADDYVEMEFGTGMVKITPSHDPNDFEVGARHNLGQCIVIDEKGFIPEGYGKYSGMDRFKARKAIVEDLEKLGLLDKVEEHDHAVGHCERCDTIIEPIISKQWFVKMENFAKEALEVYKNDELKLIPNRLGKVYENWLTGTRDWCISRQLWWGHRIPVYYCDDCGEIIVSKETPEKCVCGSTRLHQDPDTLDTWFSSALWPFSTLGWPEKTPDLDYFFPTDVLVTGYDIIFFWVIRMVFSSIYNMGEIPFKDVYFTGLIRDSQGRKMSKSLGNGIDPLEVISEYGADALRLTLVTGNSPGNDMRFYLERVESNRNFANKLWNATRFIFMNLDEDNIKDISEVKLENEDKWIISRANALIKNVDENIDKYEIGLAADKIYDFVWNEFCDWYIELVKPRLYNDDLERSITAQSTLVHVLDIVIKLLHPFMPYITEEIYSIMPNQNDMLINDNWPLFSKDNEYRNEEQKIDIMIEAIKSIRNARAELNIAPSKKSEIIFSSKDESIINVLKELSNNFKTLGGASSIEFKDTDLDEDIDAISIVQNKFKIFIPLSGLVDYNKELERLEKEAEKLNGEIKRASGKLSNEKFTAKAPEHVVQEEKDKLKKYENMLEEVNSSIEGIKAKI